MSNPLSTSTDTNRVLSIAGLFILFLIRLLLKVFILTKSTVYFLIKIIARFELPEYDLQG